jgi:collagenase-like PrtC family protease
MAVKTISAKITAAKLFPAKLTMGAVLFNWSPEKWRDFYFKIADESPVDIIYVGETVCSKRTPLLNAVLPDVIDRLQKSKKEIVFSSLAMVMNKREATMMRNIADDDSFTIEVNDVSALPPLKGRDHVIGPYINVYNEDTLQYLAEHGARRVCLSPEISFASAKILAAKGRECNSAIEMQVFGRMPLALSARCYHARVHGLTKDNCQFVCNKDPDGMKLHTLDNQPFLAVNGIQTLSDSYLDLLPELQPMRDAGIKYFRLSPHDCDMVAVSRIYKEVLEHKTAPAEAAQKLRRLLPETRFSNGYFYGTAGYQEQTSVQGAF